MDGIAWQHAVNGTPTEVAYGASVSPLKGLTTPAAQITVEMDNSANTINVAGGDDTTTANKWTTHNTYTFGTAVGGAPVITTDETKADITFKTENNFGVVRSFNMTFDIID